MITRRDLLAAAAALAPLTHAFAEAPSQDELLRFAPLGQVTLIHMTDLHGQLMPMFFREASAKIGVGEARGRLPHISGDAFLAEFGLARGTPLAHALTDLDFADLAKRFGPMGGADRMATIIKGRAPRALPAAGWRRYLARRLDQFADQGRRYGRRAKGLGR
jgi:sulfur-oxidizing protein SoxB